MIKIKRALVTGVTGQDGAYLTKLLLDKGYKVFGTYRRVSTPNFWRLQHVGVLDKMTLIPADVADKASLLEAVTLAKPKIVFNLAAQSYVGSSFDQPIFTTQVDGLGTTHFLEVIRHIDSNIRFYQASTSEMYGSAKEEFKDEKTPFIPNSPYGAVKAYSFHMTRVYRHAYDLFACNGILFNHESPLRGLEFVTRKVSNAVARIKLGLQKELKMGNIETTRDWGFAPDYVRAMYMMMKHDEPDDYVIATGECHTVREFIEEAFNHAGLNPKDHVKIDKKLYRPMDLGHLRGNASKAREVLGWKPKVKFKELVKIMVKADIDRWQKYLNGEMIPWDAPAYPDNIEILSRHPKRIFY